MISVSILLMLIGQPWAKAYDRFDIDMGSSYMDTAYSIACDTTDNTYVVVGHTDNGPLGGIDVLVTKLNANDGSVIWSRVYGSAVNNYARSVIVDYGEDITYYAVTGYTTPGFAGDPADVLIFKVDARDGSLIWGNQYGGYYETIPLADYAYSITKDGGDYLVAGNFEGVGIPAPCGGISDALVMSVNAVNGIANWAWAYGKMAYGFPTNDYLYSIIEDSTVTPCSLWVVAGESRMEIEPVSDVLVFKGKKSNGTIDPATKFLYDYLFTGQYRCAYSIKNDHSQQGYILTGDVDSSIVVMKLNPNLSVGWGGNCRIYTTLGGSGSRCIETTSDGNYVFTGFTNPGVTGPFDLLMAKIDVTGAIVWSRVLTGCPLTQMTLNDFGQCVVECDSFYVAAGYTEWPLAPWTPNNFLVAKVDVNGNIFCPQGTDTCLQDIETIVDSSPVMIDTALIDAYIAMEMVPIMDSIVSVRDSLICSRSVGIEEMLNIQLPQIKVLPSTFIYSTVISYQILARCKVSLDIYDVTGRKVSTLVNGEKDAGNYDVSFNTKELTSGIYFAKLVVGKFNETKKFTILR